MNIPKIAAGLIFNLIGVLVLYKAVRAARLKGFGDSFVDFIIGIGFVLIGLLIWNGYIS
jgi:hypothetical protein